MTKVSKTYLGLSWQSRHYVKQGYQRRDGASAHIDDPVIVGRRTVHATELRGVVAYCVGAIGQVASVVSSSKIVGDIHSHQQ